MIGEEILERSPRRAKRAYYGAIFNNFSDLEGSGEGTARGEELRIGSDPRFFVFSEDILLFVNPCFNE